MQTPDCCASVDTVPASCRDPAGKKATMSPLRVYIGFCLPTSNQAATCFELLLLYVLFTLNRLQVVHKNRSSHQKQTKEEKKQNVWL